MGVLNILHFEKEKDWILWVVQFSWSPVMAEFFVFMSIPLIDM